MNKFSKNNFYGKKSEKYNKGSEQKNSSKSNEYALDRNHSKNNNEFKRNSSRNNKGIKYQDQSIPRGREVSYFSSKRGNNNFIINESIPNRNNENRQNRANKKNFEDWIWGKHSVYSTLTSGGPINRVWCTSDIFSSEKFYTLLKDLKTRGVLIEEVPWNRLSQLTFGATHQGIALQVASSETVPLNSLIDNSLKCSNNPLIIALDGITDPHNVGAIIRSAEAFDCKGIILPQRRSAGLTGTVAKVSAGALNHIPVSRVVNLNRALEEMKRNGFLSIGLCSNCKTPISDYKEKSPLVLIIGAEDKGISLLTQKKCDYLLTIPLKGKTSSLNASVAAAIALFKLTSK